MHNQPALVDLGAECEEIHDLAGLSREQQRGFERDVYACVAGQQQQAGCGLHLEAIQKNEC
jgi:hypothetical protein